MTADEDWDHIVYPGQKGGYEVQPGEQGKLYDGFLRTGGLDKCIAVGALNRSEGTGYLKHVAGYQDEPEDFARELDDFINEILNENEPDDMQYILAGSTFDDPNVDVPVSGRDSTLRDLQNIGGQRLIAEKLFETRVEDYDTVWGADEGFMSELVVDMNNHPSFLYDSRFDVHGEDYNL